jgi:hypothetical protein
MFVAIPAAAITFALYSAQLARVDAIRAPAIAQDAERDDRNAHLPAVEDGEVVSVYSMLLAIPRRERVGAFRELPSATKAAVWRHHLTKIKTEHPELSREQRGIIDDFMALLTPDLYSLPSSDPHFNSLVENPLENIRRRAWAAFPRDLLVAVFLDMQPSESPAQPRVAAAPGLHPNPEDISYCDCNRNHDDCFFWNGSGSYCSLGCYFTSSWGCGPGWVLRCDGYCTAADPPA